MSIGSRIKEARMNKKLTQEELAQRIGVTKGAIANYENQVSVPKLDILLKLMDCLECDANYIYQDEMRLGAQKKPATEQDDRLSKIMDLVSQLTPDNQEKLSELARLYLDSQYNKSKND